MSRGEIVFTKKTPSYPTLPPSPRGTPWERSKAHIIKVEGWVGTSSLVIICGVTPSLHGSPAKNTFTSFYSLDQETKACVFPKAGLGPGARSV